MAACTLDREGGLEAPSSGGANVGGAAPGVPTGGSGGSPNTGGSGVGGTAPGVGATGPGGGDICPTGWTCVDDPAGTLVSRTEGGACPAGWTAPTPHYNDSNLPGCDNQCSCSAPQGGGCEVTVTRYDNSDCTSLKDGPTVVPLNCYAPRELTPRRAVPARLDGRDGVLRAPGSIVS